MEPGQPVLFDDGKITAVVEAVATGEAALRVVRTKPGGQNLGAQKGINLPDTVLPLTALTTDDEAQLPFIAAHADIVAVSFIRTAADVTHLLNRLEAAGAQALAVVLKIETRQGFENLPDILLTAMRHPCVAVMIARGDLAVEIGFERLSEVPQQILRLCEAAHVLAIWATQVLENLAKTGQPSRAEITDAASSQRAECVVLNKGPHVTDAIRALDDILERMGHVQTKSRTLMRHIHSWDSRLASTLEVSRKAQARSPRHAQSPPGVPAGQRRAWDFCAIASGHRRCRRPLIVRDPQPDLAPRCARPRSPGPPSCPQDRHSASA